MINMIWGEKRTAAYWLLHYSNRPEGIKPEGGNRARQNDHTTLERLKTEGLVKDAWIGPRGGHRYIATDKGRKLLQQYRHF